MNRPTPAEAFIAPELALLPALSALLDATIDLLHAQHPALDRDGQRGDSPPLRAARDLAAQIKQTSKVLHRYARVARCAARAAIVDDADLNL